MTGYVHDRGLRPRLPSARDVLAGGLAVIDGIERAKSRREQSEETGGVTEGRGGGEFSGRPS